MARLPRAKALWRPSESRTSARVPAAGELGYRQRALGAGDPTAPACSVSRRATPVPTSWAFSTRPREIELRAEEFNAYLEEDGIPDILEARRRSNEVAQGARERYSKHVKAVFQVGAPRSEDFNVVLGYPAEIVLLENPYAIGRDAPLRVRCLVDGRPVANQMVLWGGEQRGRTLARRGTRTGADGVAELTLDAAGRWYVKFVHMVRATERGLDYESKWATVTFETR